MIMKWDISLEKWTTDPTHKASGAKLGTVEYCLGVKTSGLVCPPLSISIVSMGK